MDTTSLTQFHDLTFKSVLDALPCYLTIQDADLNILFVNQTLKTTLGMASASIVIRFSRELNTNAANARYKKPFSIKKSILPRKPSTLETVPSIR